MRRLLSWILFGFSLLALTYSCIDAPSFDDIPEISNPRILLTANPISGDVGSSDTMLLLFDFKDGDGDIGYNQNDTINIPPPHVFLTFEEFDSTFTNYTIPIVPSNGGVPDITGTVKITILTSAGTFFGACLSNPQVNTVTYSVSIKDRAGNQSNELSFETVNIDCP